jgi:hypothetical protein
MPKGVPGAPASYGIFEGPLGWEVRLVRDGKKYLKQFFFRAYGDRDKALAHAQAWRDELVRAHPPQSRRDRASKLRSNNTSGIPGVSVQCDREGRPVLWLASTYIGPGQILRKAFSIGRWGAQAQALAIAERESQLSRMAGLAHVHPAEPWVRAGRVERVLPDVPPPISRPELVRTNNRSGVAGVVRRKGRNGHPGYWTAQTFVDGVAVTRSFSVLTEGEEKARALAVEERRRQLSRAMNQPDPLRANSTAR